MPTHELVTVRDEISEYWHSRDQVWTKLPFHGFGSWERHSAFCVAKDWLQDTGGAILVHRKRGFSDAPYMAYIEFWGVLQATFVQQDALGELSFALTGEKVSAEQMGESGWEKVRDLRNKAAGHPTRKDRGTKGQVFRSVTGRDRKSYESIDMMIETDGVRDHVTINLGQILDEYDREAAAILQRLFDLLRVLIDPAAETLPCTPEPS